MSDPLLLAAQRKVDRFEAAGLADQVKRARERLKEIEKGTAIVEGGMSMDNTKAELLAAAEGLDVDESNTKAEILEALDAQS